MTQQSEPERVVTRRVHGTRQRATDLATTLRAFTSPAEIGAFLHSVAILGVDPGAITRAQAEEAMAAMARGESFRLPDGMHCVADMNQRLVAAKMLLERAHGTPSDSEAIERTITQMRETLSLRPNYAALTDAELTATRSALRKALDARRPSPDDEQPEPEPEPAPEA